MAKIYGEELTRRAIEERSGSLSQFAGVRLMELSDGVELKAGERSKKSVIPHFWANDSFWGCRLSALL